MSGAATGTTGSVQGVLGDGGTYGQGVVGSSAANNGVKGTTTAGSNYAGVFGKSTASNYGTGVWGEALGGTSSSGVFGQSDNGVGVYGYASTSTGYGVYAYGTGTGYALYAHGAAGGTTTWNSSDARMKKDIQDASYGLSEIRKLRPVTYHWKDQDLGGDLQIGLIAQEVKNVIPEVVRTDPTQMLSINYIALVPVLINAVQEQQHLIERQEARIATLEGGRGRAISSFGQAGIGLGLAVVAGAVVITRRRKRSELN